jgi:branched-chain amino acid transport system ATP-binding protein
MLRLDKVTSGYEEGLNVLRDISMEVRPGTITCLLGSNGAGKSTLMKTVVHLVKPRSGKIFFEDTRIDQQKTHEIIKKGIAAIPEGRGLFPKLTVSENLRIGAYSYNDSNMIKGKMEGIFLIFPILRERIYQLAGTLSGGEQGMLSIGRALMSSPKIMLLDEPSLGLAPMIINRVMKAIREINRQGATILLIEQNATKALSIASYGYVLQKGEMTAEGDSDKLKQSEVIRAAYLRA